MSLKQKTEIRLTILVGLYFYKSEFNTDYFLSNLC